MTEIAFLACETTIPGTDRRRADAFEHDLMVAALQPVLESHGIGMRVVDWRAELDQFEGVSLAVLGTVWNYWDYHAEFLAKLDKLSERGIILCNPADVVRWNSSKTYLRELEAAGAACIPTLWEETVNTDTLRSAMEHFEVDKLVIKRQVGAGAEGQKLVESKKLPDESWIYDYPAMIQPFLPAIQDNGELSFIFIDGELSHALRKTAADGDYRIQSLYGGTEQVHYPSPSEREQASRIVKALPFETPLYARIDMLAAEDEKLLLMEAELIEPYLYPEQGPELGERLAKAIKQRVN